MSEFRSVRDMSDEEFTAEVRRVARLLAMGRYRKQNVGCADAAAVAFADQHWPDFRDAAVDFLIVREVSRGQPERPPSA